MLKLAKHFVTENLYKSGNIHLHRIGVFVLSINQQKKIGFHKIPPNNNIVFNVEVNESIPKLSWLCRIHKNRYQFTVGRNVEYSNKMVFEGAWDGNFTDSGVENSECVFGSGAVFKDGEVIFIPPKHTLELLYVLYSKTSNTTFVSNSICFILQSADINLDGPFFDKLSSSLNTTCNAATIRGVDRYDQIIVNDGKFSLYRMMYYNFLADSRGNIRIKNMLPQKQFSNYAQYSSYLTKKTSLIFANALSEQRKITYPSTTAISRGYDSPAVAVLAKKCGCKDALTLDVTVYGINDSGIEIGNKLGLKTSKHKHILADNIDNLSVKLSDELKETAFEFIATGGVGDDIAFFPFQNRLKNRLFLTGSHGDAIWEKESPAEPGMPVPGIFMKSITEYRLRVGFIYMPLPFLGSRFASPINRISSSTEMKPYSVGGEYNRPIPRRIAEEAGLLRDDFGIAKNATAPLMLNHSDLFKESVEKIVKRYGNYPVVKEATAEKDRVSHSKTSA